MLLQQMQKFSSRRTSRFLTLVLLCVAVGSSCSSRELTETEMIGTFAEKAWRCPGVDPGDPAIPASAVTELWLRENGTAQAHDIPLALFHSDPRATGLGDACGAWEFTRYRGKQRISLTLTISSDHVKPDSERAEHFQLECHRSGEGTEVWFVLDEDGSWFTLTKR
jgi:hypothetical protein